MRFIEEWRTVLLGSNVTWTAAITGAIVGILTVVGAQWALLLNILIFMPLWVQLPVAIIVGAVVIGGPTIIARLRAQPKLQAKIAEKSNVAP